VIPIITGAAGTISRSFRKFLSNIPGKHEIKEVQIKTAVLDIAHVHNSENTNIKYKTYVTCEITLHVTQIVNTE
jgi:hypothetical protein